jgi:hypothetical protein
MNAIVPPHLMALQGVFVRAYPSMSRSIPGGVSRYFCSGHDDRFVVHAAVLRRSLPCAQREISNAFTACALTKYNPILRRRYHGKESADLLRILCGNYAVITLKDVVAMDELPMKRLDVPPKTSLGEAARLTGPKHSEHSNQ